MKGQVFGALRVVNFAGSGADGHARWGCKCLCGGRATVFGFHLEKGETVTCGCKILRKGKAEGAPMTVFSLARMEMQFSLSEMSARVGCTMATWKRLERGALYEKGENDRVRGFLTRRLLESFNALMETQSLFDLKIERQMHRFKNHTRPANVSVEFRECLTCKTPFPARLDQIAQGNGLYCSRDCAGMGRRNRKTIPCLVCGIGVEVKVSRPIKTTRCDLCRALKL